MRPPSIRSLVALCCGAIGAFLGRPGLVPAQPPVVVRTPGLPEPDGSVTATERVADWSNYHRSGWQKMDRGWYDSAEREFLGAIRAAHRTAAGTRTRFLAQSYFSLAWALERQGRSREAEPLARWVLDVWRSEYGEASPATARGATLVATIALDLAKLGEAEAALRPMLAVDPGPNGSAALRQEQARGQSLLGLVLATGQRFSQAEGEYERAIARHEALRPRDDSAIGDDYNNLAWCRIEQRKLPQARDAMNRALALLESSRGANDPTVGRALDGLARIDADQDDLGAAESKLLRSIAIYEAGGPATQERLADDLRRYAALLDRMKRPRDAAATRDRLARLADPRPSPAAAPALAPPSPPRNLATRPGR